MHPLATRCLEGPLQGSIQVVQHSRHSFGSAKRVMAGRPEVTAGFTSPDLEGLAS